MTSADRPRDAASRLASLGLPATAGVDELRAARDKLAGFLASAPDDLAGWAEEQLGDADALLADLDAAPAQASDDDGTYADVAALDAGVPAPPRPAASGPAKAKPRTRALLPLLAAGLLIGLVWSVYLLNDRSAALPANHPTATATAASTPAATPAPLDEQLIAEWKAKVAANPADAVSLRAIAEEYFRVSRFGEAATWQAKVVELKPTDVDSRLILGVAYFNDNQFDQAKAQWLKAAELDPTSPDPYYNLGFLHLSTDPPDPVAAEAAWRKVIELAPGSEIADTVESHIQSLDTSPSPTPSPSK